MTALELDLPLEKAPAGRFLIWISMALVFVAVLAFALAAMSDRSVREFERRPKIMTVALTSVDTVAAEAAQTAQILAYLKGVEGVAFADPVSEKELGMLVEPWLGDSTQTENLPLPRLIDVGFNPGIEPDIVGIDLKLQELAPGASIGYGGMEADTSEALSRLVRGISLLVGLFVIVITVVSSAVVTRMSLKLNNETVDLLQLMGAGDQYIARQFEQHALHNTLRGALIGFALAILILLGFIWLGKAELMGGVTIELRPLDWVLLAMTPIIATVLTAMVAKHTARLKLKSALGP